MAYNLIVERWIPVRRRSGMLDMIAPWQIAEAEDPPLRVESPRPDFDGALLQFLIGLVQTVMAPAKRAEWNALYDKPPTPETLRAKCEGVISAFNLDGPGPRFMQDLTLDPEDAVECDIGSLLIDMPGEQTIENNVDFFVKRGCCKAMGPPAAAMALFTLQTNAPSGGQGHRTSLRGGGPLTTVVLGDTLFRTVWLNVLREEIFLHGPGNPELRDSSYKFPWLAPTRTSEKDTGSITTPENVHPVQHYWAMPRRVRLDFDSAALGRCEIFGSTGGLVVTHYFARNYGTNYKGAYRHPLTPYTVIAPDEPPNPKKVQSEGLPYRDWPHFTIGVEGRQPARVVHAFQEDERYEKLTAARLLAFGYDMDNMKARGWYAATTPLLVTAREYREAFSASVQGCVATSEIVRKTLLSQLKKALEAMGQDLPWDSSLMAEVSRCFWADTEHAFFSTNSRLRDALEAGAAIDAICEEWLHTLHRAALSNFEGHSQEIGDFAATDVKRISVAWNQLRRFTSPRSKKLRAAVNLGPIVQGASGFGGRHG